MKRTYEIYEDNGGGIHMIILEDDSPIRIYSGFEYTQAPGVILDAMEQLKADPNAFKSWGGDLMAYLEENGVDRTIDDVYEGDFLSSPSEMIAWAGEDCNLEHINPGRIGYNGCTALGLDDEF